MNFGWSFEKTCRLFQNPTIKLTENKVFETQYKKKTSKIINCVKNILVSDKNC